MKLKYNLRLSLFILTIIGLCLIAQSSWATTAYVTDSFTITLRTGPSNQNKIIAMLSSGNPVEVLESDGDWSQVRVLEGKMSGKEGWVFSRYLLTRLPWKKQSESLRKENELLKDKLPVVEKKLNDALQREKTLTIKLRDNTKTLNTLEGEYTSLKQGSGGYLKLKKKYDETQSALKTAQQNLQKFTEENKILKSSQAIKWFLAGSLVLLFGLIIGLVVGQRQKKQRSTLMS